MILIKIAFELLTTINVWIKIETYIWKVKRITRKMEMKDFFNVKFS